MPKLARLLVPVDFSDSARHAARYAESLAHRFGGDVTLLHVAPPFDFAFSMAEAPAFRDGYIEGRNRSLRTALEQFPGHAAMQRELREGDAAEEIIARAHEGSFDALVMPTRRASVLRQILLMGSVTSKVLAGVHCPVFTGFHRGFAENVPRFESIVCAIDLGPATDRVLCWGSELSSAFGARWTVVHAAPEPGEVAGDYFDDAWRTTLVSTLHQRIEDVLRQGPGDPEISVEAGPTARVVMSAAERAQCDLLIVGRGTSGDLLGRLRANAWDLIRQSPCPVLSV